MFCRPIRFRYVKEFIENQNLELTVLSNVSTVQHLLELTMVDRKVASALSEKSNSSQCCPVYGITPSKMNNIDVCQKKKVIYKINLSMACQHYMSK